MKGEQEAGPDEAPVPTLHPACRLTPAGSGGPERASGHLTTEAAPDESSCVFLDPGLAGGRGGRPRNFKALGIESEQSVLESLPSSQQGDLNSST